MLFMENVVFSVFENDVGKDGLLRDEKKDRRMTPSGSVFTGPDRRGTQQVSYLAKVPD